MGVTKTTLFTKEQNEIASLAKAFGHPARVAIIQQLLKSNTCINSGLVKELGLAQATISQHLRELKEMGIIIGNIEGVSISYCINPAKWTAMQELFNNFFQQFSCESDNCC